MNRIAKAFEQHKAFIPFITAGDPDLETSRKVIEAAIENGADLIEIGIPFSDPTAEGPVIMEADNIALRSGTTTDRIFDMTKELRNRYPDIPFVYMTYANVVYSYGTERFAERAKEAGIDGMILPDVPYEEKGDFDPVLSQYGIDLISMIAPTSKERDCHDRKGGERLPVCRIVPWRHRDTLEHHNRYRGDDLARAAVLERPLRRGLWHFRPRTGRGHGRRVGRRHRRLRYRAHRQ